MVLLQLVAASVAVAGCATYPDQYGYDPYYNNGYYTTAITGQRLLPTAITATVRHRPATSSPARPSAPSAARSPARSFRASAPGSGAIAGAILGGVLGATVNGRQYYRDTRGYCYYVDQYGQPHYSYDIRC